MGHPSHSFTYRGRLELQHLQRVVTDHRRTESRNRRRRERKINELQEDLEFLALMNRALLEVVLKAGLCDTHEFAALVEALDAADGEADGGYDLDQLREETGQGKEPPVDKVAAFREAYQRSLTRRRGEGPR